MGARYTSGVGIIAAGVISVGAFTTATQAGFIFIFNGNDGLSAEAEFTLVNATTLEIRFRNTSTGVPDGFDESDQILTGLSWDFGSPGFAGSDVEITGGTAFTGPTSSSINFDVQNVGPNENVGGEWGFGNNNGTGALENFISSSTAQATPFGGPNLDGPVNMDGPQGGLVANPVLVPLNGLGAIQDEIIATVNLDGPITEAMLLSDLLGNGTRVEFGSDAAFVPGQLIPAPGVLAVFGLAGLMRRRRR